MVYLYVYENLIAILRGVNIMKVLALKGDISLISVQDDALLLDVAKRFYYELNDPALFLLKSMEGGCSEEQLREKIVAAYIIDPETAASDIGRFIAELSRFDLLETVEEAGAPVDLAAPVKDKKDKRAYQPPLLRLSAEVMSVVSGMTMTPK